MGISGIQPPPDMDSRLWALAKERSSSVDEGRADGATGLTDAMIGDAACVTGCSYRAKTSRMHKSATPANAKAIMGFLRVTGFN